MALAGRLMTPSKWSRLECLETFAFASTIITLCACEHGKTTSVPVVASSEVPTTAKGEPPQVLPKPAPKAAIVGDGVEQATAWLNALAQGDLDALTRQTGFPFRLRDSRSGHCAPLAIADVPTQMASTIQCASSDEALKLVIRDHQTGGFDPLTHDQLQPWAKPWAEELSPEWKVVTAYFSRPEGFVEVDLAVAQDGVRAVWKTGLDGTRQAQLTSRWLAALRADDYDTLASLTSYPFELRDRGRRATCGTRTAASADSIPSTVRCLSGNAVLRQALENSTEAPAIVAHGDDELPDWASPWLKKQREPEPTRVTVLTSTPAGDEFELLLLVDPTGVRALFKSGGFEATE
jgi:hypothetical protein